ncbi:MAG: tetratricopeptide repeat protein [Bacteroidaceae bacterium]|nr:tetratricopeptide repeat protein [Bacteroidaceae bacterium]
MKRKFFLFLILQFLFLVSHAQQAPLPKFASKVQKAIVQLTTFDKDGNQLHTGTAFYVGENGEALADYALMKDACKATVTDQSGKTAEVDCIKGADDTYSMVRFLVNTKGNAVLTVSTTAVAQGAAVYALPFTQQKSKVCASGTVVETSPVKDQYSYYALSANLGAEVVGAPVFNESGELVGILQSAVGGKSYVMDIRFREELKISAFMPTSTVMALSGINIVKGLPDTKEEALVYTYFKSQSASNAEYSELIDRFIRTYPDNAEGYYRRATLRADLRQYDEAEADLRQYESLSENKDAASVYASTLRAQILTVQGKVDDALALYERLCNEGHQSPGILYAMSTLHEARSDSLSDILSPLDTAIASFGTPLPREAANYVLRRGQVLANNGKYREAVLDYNQYAYLVNSKVNARFYYERSQIEVNARMYQQAYDDITSAVSAAPSDVVYRVEKAAICLRVNQVAECIEACQAALALDPNQPDAHRILGYAQIQQGDKAAARQSLQRAIDLGDENAKTIMDAYLK